MIKPLPEPPVPPDCDLRNFQFMPLDVQRLRSSDLAAMEKPDACWAAVMLWCASWHQVPASSLPDDDRVLANLAGYGRDVKRWGRVRAGALRGFVKAKDGRLYHSVIAEKALEAWLEKVAQRISGGEGNAKRWRVTFDRTLLDAALTDARRRLEALNPQSRALMKIQSASPPDSPPDSQRDRKGQGQGQGQGQGHKEQRPGPSDSRSDVRRSAPLGQDEDQALARRMFAAVKVVAPSAKEPNWNGWANAIRLMREQDDRTLEQIEALFTWANRDSFWRANILSPATLRDKWTQLEAKRIAPAGGNGARGAPPVDPRWWKSDEGVKAHGAKLNVEARPKEDILAYTARVFIAAGEGPWMETKNGTLMRFIRELRAEGAIPAAIPTVAMPAPPPPAEPPSTDPVREAQYREIVQRLRQETAKATQRPGKPGWPFFVALLGWDSGKSKMFVGAHFGRLAKNVDCWPLVVTAMKECVANCLYGHAAMEFLDRYQFLPPDDEQDDAIGAPAASAATAGAPIQIP